MRQSFGFTTLLAIFLVFDATSHSIGAAEIGAAEKVAKPKPTASTKTASPSDKKQKALPKPAAQKPSSESKPATKSKPGKSEGKGMRKNRANGRYQMLKSGDVVIVLDTHTGETRLIETETEPTLQRVDVGRAWVVVTVLGNASPTHREMVSPKSATTKTSKSQE